jgi:hypothetical protein
LSSLPYYLEWLLPLFTIDTGFKACRFTDNHLIHSLLLILSSLMELDHPTQEGNQTCCHLGIVVGHRGLGTSWAGFAAEVGLHHRVLIVIIVAIIATIASERTSAVA